MGNTKNFHSLNRPGKDGLNTTTLGSTITSYGFPDVKGVFASSQQGLLSRPGEPYLFLAGELHLPLGDLAAEVIDLAAQLHDLVVGPRGLVQLFGQEEILVVQLCIVFSELVQLLFQI